MDRLRMASMCGFFMAAGYLAHALLPSTQLQAQGRGDRVYKAVLVNSGYGSPDHAASLNAAARGGWKVVAPLPVNGWILFEK